MEIVQTKKKSANPIVEESDREFALFRHRKELHTGQVPSWFVYINDYAWEAFLSHTELIYERTRHEGQGIFGGRYFKDDLGEFAVATTYYEGEGSSTHSHVEMSEECLSAISKHCHDENLLMLIWVHTHPTFGAFYSGTDTACLRTNFFMPFQIGIVVDIVRKELKAFRVRDSEVAEFEHYALYNEEQAHLFRPYERHDIDIHIKKKNSDPLPTESSNILQGLKDLGEGLEAIRGLVNDQIEKQNASNSSYLDLMSSQLVPGLRNIQIDVQALHQQLREVNSLVGRVVSLRDRSKKWWRIAAGITTLVLVLTLALVVLISLRHFFWR